MGGRTGETNLSAHALSEPITWRRLRGQGAPWITCLPAPGQAVLGRDGVVSPPEGRSLESLWLREEGR